MIKKYRLILTLCFVSICMATGWFYYKHVEKEKYWSVMTYIYTSGEKDYAKAVEKMYEVYPTQYDKQEELINSMAWSWRKEQGIGYTTDEVLRHKLYIDDFKKEYLPDLYVKPTLRGVKALEITDKSYTVDGNYGTISGSAKNIGDSTISYYKITIKLMDSSGNVLDSIWTNNSGQFNPGESSKWEKTFDEDKRYEKYRVEVTEVKH